MAKGIFDIQKKDISDKELKQIEDFFKAIKYSSIITDFSEIVDIHSGKMVRNKIKLKQLLRAKEPVPFMFITCLN